MVAAERKKISQNMDGKLTYEDARPIGSYCGFALELNTAGLESPEDCEEIYGQALLPYMKKYDVPVSL